MIEINQQIEGVYNQPQNPDVLDRSDIVDSNEMTTISDPEGKALTLKDPVDRLGIFLGVSENKISTVTLPESWIHATVIVARDRLAALEMFLTESQHVMPSTRLIALEEGGNYRIDVLCANETAMNFLANAYSALVVPSQLNENRTGLFVPGSGFINRGATVNSSLALYKNHGERGTVVKLNALGVVATPPKLVKEVTVEQLNETPNFAASMPEPATTEAVRFALSRKEYTAPNNRNSTFKLIPLAHPNIDAILEDVNRRLVGNQIYCGQLGDYLVVGDCSEQNSTLDISRAKNEYNQLAEGTPKKGAKIFFNKGHVDPVSRTGMLRKIGNLNLRDLGIFDGMKSDEYSFVVMGGALARVHEAAQSGTGRVEKHEREGKKYGMVKGKKLNSGLTLVTDVKIEYHEDTSELIGEEAEAAVQKMAKWLVNGKGGTMVIHGDAGLGKTTLFQHAVRRAGRIVATMLGIEADQFIAGENILHIVKGLAERAQTRHPDDQTYAKFLESVAIPSAALRTKLTDSSTQATVFKQFAFACCAMGIDLAIDDWHFLGTDTPAVEKLLDEVEKGNPGRKRIIISRFNDSKYASKCDDKNPDSYYFSIEAPGVDYKQHANATKHLENCLGVKLHKPKNPRDANEKDPGKYVIDAAQAVRIGAVSRGNPLYFKTIVASLLDQNAYSIEGDVFKVNDAFLEDIEHNLTNDDQHAAYAANRVAALDRHPMGEGVKDFVQAIAILGRLPVSARDVLIKTVCPQAIRSEEKMVQSLITGLHITEEPDPITGEHFYVMHNRIGTMVRERIDVGARLQLQQKLHTAFGASLDLDTRFKLEMNIIDDVEIKRFVQALKTPDADENSQLLAFVGEFFTNTYAHYSEEMRGRNALEVTRATAEKVISLPVVEAMSNMLNNEDSGAIAQNTQLISTNAHLRNIVTAYVTSLFDIAEVSATQGKKEDSAAAIAKLKALGGKYSGIVDDHRVNLSEYNANYIGADAGSDKDFAATKKSYESLLALTEKKLETLQADLDRAEKGSAEEAECLYSIGEVTTQITLASQRLISRVARNRSLGEEEKMSHTARLQSLVNVSSHALEAYNIEHARRNHGIPSPLVLEFLRIRDIATPRAILAEKLEKPNIQLGIGIGAGGVSEGRIRDSLYAESTHAMGKNDIPVVESIAHRCREMLAILKAKPTAMPTQIVAGIMDANVRVDKYLGQFVRARRGGQELVDYSLNTGNYNAAVTGLAYQTHALRLSATTQPVAGKGTIEARNFVQLTPLLTACDIAYGAEAHMIEANVASNAYNSFYLASMRLETVADITPSNITATGVQATQTYTRADAAKIAEAKLDLHRIRGHLENACTTMKGVKPYGFAPGFALGANVRAGAYQSYVIPAFAEICALMRAFNEDPNVQKLGYNPLEYSPVLAEAPSLTPENIWAAMIYHEQAEHRDPAFAADYARRGAALATLLSESISTAKNLGGFLEVFENTALRYRLNAAGELESGAGSPNEYPDGKGGTLYYFAQRDLVAMHSPFAVTEGNTSIVVQVRDRLATLLKEDSQNPQLVMDYSRALMLSGDNETAHAILSTNREICINANPELFLTLQARVGLLTAKTQHVEQHGTNGLDTRKTADFKPQELFVAYKHAQVLENFRRRQRTDSDTGVEAIPTTTVAIEADVESMLIQMDAIAALGRHIISVLKKQQLLAALQQVSSSDHVIPQTLLTKCICDSIREKRFRAHDFETSDIRRLVESIAQGNFEAVAAKIDPTLLSDFRNVYEHMTTEGTTQEHDETLVGNIAQRIKALRYGRIQDTNFNNQDVENLLDALSQGNFRDKAGTLDPNLVTDFTQALNDTQTILPAMTQADAVKKLVMRELGCEPATIGLNEKRIADYLVLQGMKKKKLPLTIFDSFVKTPLKVDSETNPAGAFFIGNPHALAETILPEIIALYKRLDAYISAQKKAPRPLNDVQRNSTAKYARDMWIHIERLIKLIPAEAKERHGLILDRSALSLFNDEEPEIARLDVRSRFLFAEVNTYANRFTSPVIESLD